MLEVRFVIGTLGLAVALSGCFASRMSERAYQDLGCGGLRLFTYPVNEKYSREQPDGTARTYCCSTDSSKCAEYFCPADEKSGCTRL